MSNTTHLQVTIRDRHLRMSQYKILFGHAGDGPGPPLNAARIPNPGGRTLDLRALQEAWERARQMPQVSARLSRSSSSTFLPSTTDRWLRPWPLTARKARMRDTTSTLLPPQQGCEKLNNRSWGRFRQGGRVLRGAGRPVKRVTRQLPLFSSHPTHLLWIHPTGIPSTHAPPPSNARWAPPLYPTKQLPPPNTVE
ncbi:hypothetical protein Hypma_016160 [Hypsizygus marmoreus]|uniref:Uncharacterized protein n=1 Tax=Hypsizygus marmoreus TaxID=39966 RepID=A0A369J7Z1_HYPMA|nr:hypothetical protein Hypma_016160 [Hypsizygus marmoreus]